MPVLDLTAQVAARGFDVTLSIAAGETVAVLGPNGAGKSTLLGVIAGLLRPSGRATLGGTVLFDDENFTPPHRRGVSLLAQDALLFPHLSVLDNVAFGPRSAGRRDSRERALHWLAEVEAVHLAERRAPELSGGQAQRVAIARALASEPRLLLLDEPMAALDVSAAPALRRLLSTVLRQRTAIIVTHEILDAYSVADRVVVMNDGHIVEQGPTREVLERPRTAFTATLAGLNLIQVGEQLGAIRPADVTISPAPTGHPGTVTDLEPHGDFVRVRSADLAADVHPRLVADLDLAPGSSVWFDFAPGRLSVYPKG